MKDVNENNVFTAPSVSQRAALHALRMRHEIVPPIRELYRDRLMHAYERVCGTPGMSSLQPGGSIYLWVNISETGLSSAEVSERIFDEAHVLTLPGNAFGDCGEGYLRLAMTVSRERIDEAFDRIARTAVRRLSSVLRARQRRPIRRPQRHVRMQRHMRMSARERPCASSHDTARSNTSPEYGFLNPGLPAPNSASAAEALRR